MNDKHTSINVLKTESNLLSGLCHLYQCVKEHDIYQDVVNNSVSNLTYAQELVKQSIFSTIISYFCWGNREKSSSEFGRIART
jgi:hypothetical protein